MGRITKTGRLVVSAKTLRHLKGTVTKIDRRLKGKKGMTAHGKVIRNPRAYVFGGLRKSLKR
jgi:hypothetical protein